MNEDALAVLLAVFFTCGCITIHEMRRHAKAMTPPLTLVMVCLFLFVTLIAMAERPDDGRGEAAGPRGTKTKSSVTPISNTDGRQVLR